ncbi:MAG: acyl-CoA thioesterase [Pararhodobacter sp.]|nr:acyl-CoA thioesterase [Pararhodobacter sp.]
MNVPLSLCETAIDVSFGDCDPAGITFYPNFFRWTDGLFHSFLRERAHGHNAICAQLGAKGLGVIATEMRFRSPALDGDTLQIVLNGIEWSERSFTLAYSGQIEDRVVFEAIEKRGVFVQDGERMSLAGTNELQHLLG